MSTTVMRDRNATEPSAKYRQFRLHRFGDAWKPGCGPRGLNRESRDVFRASEPHSAKISPAQPGCGLGNPVARSATRWREELAPEWPPQP
eukprot:5959521-Prymnesium_polylepis.1